MVRSGEIFRSGTYTELLQDEEASQLIRKLETESSLSASSSNNARERDASSSADEPSSSMSSGSHRRSKTSSFRAVSSVLNILFYV